MDINEKKELAFNSYKKSFDKTLAYQRAGMTDEEIELVDADETYQQRLSLALSTEQERIIGRLRDFMDCEDLKISFQATTDLGKILYPEFFKRLNAPVNVKVTKEMSEDEMERISKEYSLLLGNKHVVKKSADSESE